MLEKLKSAWRYIAIIAGLIAAFVVGLVSSGKISGWFRKTDGGGISGSGDAGAELESGLGKLEVNQQSASHRLDDLSQVNQRITGNQQESSRIIDSAENRLDRLEDILGIPKND